MACVPARREAGYWGAFSQRGRLSASALTVGGLGLADFVVLFLRRPWQDVAKNLSNSEQVRMLMTSYYVSLSFLDRDKLDAIGPLEAFTASLVKLMQTYVEEDLRTGATPATASSPGDRE